ncbi:MAG: 3-oxoacyl-ACP reductase FabG [Chloroflexi bacterium]|nr:3-oxoacyl-ACP reductase FabG [Chloroflexota bacterium]
MRLKGKVAIVTAAAGAGIGQAVARTFAREGASVVVSDVHPGRTAQIAQDIQATTGQRTLGIVCNVADAKQVEDLVKQTVEQLGRIDILVNNAGTNRLSPVADMTDEIWDSVMNVCLRGTFHCCRAVLPTMTAQKFGRIINLSSIYAWIGEADQAHYCAAKAAIIAFTKSLARETARQGITVNAVAPGITWNDFLTRIYPPETIQQWHKEAITGRLGQPQDVANAILFLASDEAEHITGETLCISGGTYMH